MNRNDQDRRLRAIPLALAGAVSLAIGAVACGPEPDSVDNSTVDTGVPSDAEVYDEAYDAEGVEQPMRTDVGEPGGADLAQDMQQAAGVVARAQLQPASDSGAGGTLEFRQDGEGVRVEGEVTGLAPGEHGIHVHEFGDCSAPDGSSAGDHFAPRSSKHGAPDDAPGEHHAGDLGNIEAGDDGQADVAMVDDSLSLQGAESIVGRAIVVHADADDLESQPSGNSGDRVACGVIERQSAPPATG